MMKSQRRISSGVEAEGRSVLGSILKWDMCEAIIPGD